MSDNDQDSQQSGAQSQSDSASDSSSAADSQMEIVVPLLNVAVDEKDATGVQMRPSPTEHPHVETKREE